MSPAICTAVNSTWTTKPRAAPMTTSVTAVTTRNPAVGFGSVGAIVVESSTDRARASAPLTAPGMTRELNGGASRTKPAARAVPRSRAASVTAGTERSIALRPVEQRRQLVEQGVGEADQLRQHPVPGHRSEEHTSELQSR